ncbi:MAG: glutathione binding-like protein, partial [Steroidobacteraceae bacterium]
MSALSGSSEHTVAIYHIEGRRSFRVIWLCEELQIPYELIFTPGDLMASMSRLRKDHPLMPIVPTVRYEGQFVVESGAILDVLATRFGKGRLLPDSGSPDYLRHAQWMHFAEATALARMSAARHASLLIQREVDELPPGYRASAAPTTIDPRDPLAFFAFTVGPLGIFDFIEDYLSRHPYFGGSAFSAADVMMQFSIRGAKLLVGIDPDDYPNIRRWKAEVESRPA